MTARPKNPADLLAAALDALGFGGDPEMADTAERFAELLREFRPTSEDELRASMVALPSSASTRSSVAIRDMPFHSLCAHHLVPFWGTASVAYLPRRSLAGLGSIARVVQHYARRPQLQERLADQIADLLFETLAPEGLVVRLVARQMCMEMRGARSLGEVEVQAVRGEVDARLYELVRG
jgi:GTP cyclohydrolase I